MLEYCLARCRHLGAETRNLFKRTNRCTFQGNCLGSILLILTRDSLLLVCFAVRTCFQNNTSPSRGTSRFWHQIIHLNLVTKSEKQCHVLCLHFREMIVCFYKWLMLSLNIQTLSKIIKRKQYITLNPTTQKFPP